MIVSEAKLTELAQRLVAGLHPRRIILFGSQAWGKPTGDSDVDLLVVVEHSDEPAYRRARRAYRSLQGVRVACDVLVHTLQEVETAKRVPASLLRRIVEEGRVPYG